MDEVRVRNEQNTWTLDTSMLPNKLEGRRFMSHIVPQRKWLEISLRSPYRVHFSLKCVTISWKVKNLVTRFYPGVCNIDDDNTRKQKFIGTRKCDSEAVAKISHNHVTKDQDSSTKDDSSRNIQRTTHLTIVDDEGSVERGDGLDKQRGNNSDVVKPRSYRDVLVNGGNKGQMMT